MIQEMKILNRVHKICSINKMFTMRTMCYLFSYQNYLMECVFPQKLEGHFFFFFWSPAMRHVGSSSQARDGIPVPWLGPQSLNQKFGPPGEVKEWVLSKSKCQKLWL